MEVLNAQFFSDQTDGPPHAGPKNMQIVLVKRHILLCVLFIVASLIFSFDSVQFDWICMRRRRLHTISQHVSYSFVHSNRRQ